MIWVKKKEARRKAERKLEEYCDNQGRNDGGFTYSSGGRNRKKGTETKKAGIMVLGFWT